MQFFIFKSTLSWPASGSNSEGGPRGLPFFRLNQTNVTNFLPEVQADWKTAFRGSETLCWKDGSGKAVSLYVIGRVGRANLETALSDYGNDPGYRLELTVDRDTGSALRNIFDNGPLQGLNDINYPLLGRTATFSAKLKTLHKTDAPDLDVEAPFPYIFDGNDADDRKETFLTDFAASDLTTNQLVVVETIISSYTIPAKGLSSGRSGYSMSLREIYVIHDPNSASGGHSDSLPRDRKRQGDSLVSPRRNIKGGERALFSDDH